MFPGMMAMLFPNAVLCVPHYAVRNVFAEASCRLAVGFAFHPAFQRMGMDAEQI